MYLCISIIRRIIKQMSHYSTPYHIMKQDRIDSISLMRVLAMTMIVAFHSLLFYTETWWYFGGITIPTWVHFAKFLNSLDLSMFVFISGFLFGWLYIYKGKYRDKHSFLLSKAKRLIVPYLLWGGIMILIQPSLVNWNNLLTGISHLWFLLMLFWVFCFIIIIQRKLNENISYTKICLLLFIAYIIWLLYNQFSTHHYLLRLESALSYFPAFLIGYFCASKKIWLMSNKNTKAVLIITLILLAFYIFSGQQLPEIIDDIIIRLLSYTFIISLFIVLNKIKCPNRLFFYIERFDKLSMGVYIFNQIVVNFLLMNLVARDWLNIHYQIGPLVIFFISLIIPLCLSYVFNRIKWLSWTIGS